MKCFHHRNLEEKVMHYIKMASLVYYSFSRGFTKASIIADMAKNHTYFKYAANGITPNEDTINNFINIWGSFFEYTITYSVQVAQMAGFTNFNNYRYRRHFC